MDCSLPGSSVHGFSRQEYWSGLPFPSPNACCRISQCSRTGTNSTSEKGLKKKRKKENQLAWLKSTLRALRFPYLLLSLSRRLAVCSLKSKAECVLRLDSLVCGGVRGAQLKAAVVHRGCFPQCWQSGDIFQARTWKKFFCVIMTSLREKVLKIMTSEIFS